MKVCIINYYYFTNYKAIMHYSEDEKTTTKLINLEEKHSA